jgi:hypothetical protein
LKALKYPLKSHPQLAFRDLTSQRFGKWIVLERAENGTNGATRFLCLCDCGTKRSVLATSLVDGRSTSCNCQRKGKLHKNETGKHYGDWFVIRQSENKGALVQYLCRCKCGTERNVIAPTLRNGTSTGCGCTANRLPEGLAARNNLYKQYKGTSKKRGYEFTLTKEVFFALVKGNCHYCGVEPRQVRRLETGDRFTYNGLDRVRNSEGYKENNVVPCCKQCNYAKRTLTQDEFYAWIARLVTYQNSLDARKDS